MPKVSIVMPAYNPGPYIRPAIQSVLKQTFTDWELIIVDDGSTEDIRLNIPPHPGIKYIRQINRGRSSARNIGIMHSAGELIAFLDADDLWHKDKLAVQVSFMNDHPEAGMSATDFEIVDSQGTKTANGWGVHGTDYFDILSGPGFTTCTVMIRREFLFIAGLFDPVISYMEDHDLYLKVAMCTRILMLKDVLAYYRLHTGNTSLNCNLPRQFHIAILRKHIIRAKGLLNKKNEIIKKAHEGIKKVKRYHGLVMFEEARVRLIQRDWKKFLIYMVYAFHLNPIYAIRRILFKFGLKY